MRHKMGDIIKNLRIEHKMTQEELGKQIGVQKSAIRKYEAGIVENIPKSSIQKMATIFNVKPSYIMGWEDTATSTYSRSNVLDSSFISQHELKIVDAYRTNPEMQQAVDTLLNVKRDPTLHIVKKAARNGKYKVFTLTDDEFQKMKAADEALEDAPDDM